MKTEFLVGENFFHINHNTIINQESALNYSPHWHSRPYTNGSISLDPSGYPRLGTSTKIVSEDSINKELLSNYATKSIMSLDGLFSPISFYPTPYSSTYHITKYPTPSCPFCDGTKNYSFRQYNSAMVLQAGGAAELDSQLINYSSPCPFCESIEDKKKAYLRNASPREGSPPYIIASGEDLQIISTINTVSGSSGIPTINYSTLNPFVLMTGEFSNFQNKQSGDLTAFSIDAVAYGSMLPRSGDSVKPFYSDDPSGVFSDRDITLDKWIAQMRSKGYTSFPALSGGRKNNIRSFALRGPIMLHSWGYDIDGFPVPNSSGEPLVEGGSIVRDSDGNIIGKNQTRLGNNNWTKPYPENTFYKGWAQTPGCWPVGPIDFRWDHHARVWTVGANYKPVFIILEEDMVNIQPVRGSVLDSSLSNNPLPSGLRKLVFVKDALGLYAAPRGAVLYCRYDSQNGFYEPLVRNSYVTSGNIISQTTVEIYKIYSPPPQTAPSTNVSNPPVVDRYETTFTNPLNFAINIGDKGLFTFIGSGWVLQSYKCG